MPDLSTNPNYKLLIKLCQDALKQAGLESGFFVDMAFRHQCILHAQEWQNLQNLNQSDAVLEQFAQRIVNEVVASSQDNWAIQLVKTSYLGKLNAALASSKLAIEKITSTATIWADEAEQDPTSNYLNALKAQADYLDSLMDLPFILEKMVLGLIGNTPTANYQPKKTAAMLAMALDTIQSGLELSNADLNTHLIKGLKLAIQIVMPGDLLEDVLVDTVQKLLPFINQILRNTKQLNAAKAVLFTKNEFGQPTDESLAHKQMLAMLNVHFETIQDILSASLLEPVDQLTQAYVDANGVVESLNLAAQEDNSVNKLLKISRAFNHLDKIHLSSNALDPNLLPIWVKDANQYYQGVRNRVLNLAGEVVGGVSSIFAYAYDLIPAVVRQYFTADSVLCVNALLQEIDSKDATQNREKVVAYYSFYKLATHSKVDGALKELFFEKYMKEIREINPNIKVKEVKEEKDAISEFDEYLILEKQFKTKLTSRNLTEAGNRRRLVRTDTSIPVFARQGLTPEKMHALALIHDLQTIESKFDAKNPLDTFDDLQRSASNPDQQTVFKDKFLLPAMQRLVTRYQTEIIIPLLEHLLDNDLLLSKEETIRRVYSNLKSGFNLSDEDIKCLKMWIQTPGLPIQSNPLRMELTSLQAMIQYFPKQVMQPIDFMEIKPYAPEVKEYSTPKELQKQHATSLFNNYTEQFKPLLRCLMKGLNDQLNDCHRLLDLMQSAGQPTNNIELLCLNKMRYLEALKEFILKLQKSSQFNLALLQLLTGETALLSFEALEQQRKDLSLKTLSEKVLNFIGTALPNETFFRNLFNHCIKDSLLEPVILAERNFTETLNNNPIPAALMTVLSDPLSKEQIIPSKEKIMDEVVNQLLEQGISSGLGYLKQAAARMAGDYLFKLMPYPFLAELVYQVINSDPVQREINRKLNGLVKTYGSYLGKATHEFKEQVKIKLYPMLNIEMQKAIQADAYRYAQKMKGESQETDTERDAFAIYFLQYNELKANKPDLPPEAIISHLFTHLLQDETDQAPAIIATIAEAFAFLGQQVNLPLVNGRPIAIEEELAYLIARVDFNQPENQTLIQLALINRLLIITLKASERTMGAEQTSLLQDNVVKQLSALLTRAYEQVPVPIVEEFKSELGEEFKVAPNEHKATYQAIRRALSGTPNKLVSQMQLKLVTTALQNALQTVKTGIRTNQSMLTTPDLLDISLAKWEYSQATRARKLFYGLKILGEGLSFGLTLAGIVLTLVATTGVTSLLTAALLSLGAFILGPIAVLRFGYKLFAEVMKNKIELSKASPGAFTGLIFKCLGLALAKTVLSDYLLVKITTLTNPFQRLRTVFFSWPSRNSIEAEQGCLTDLQPHLEELIVFIANQRQFLESVPNTTDQSAALQQKAAVCEDKLNAVLTQLNQANKEMDARFPMKSHQTVLTQFNVNFAILKKEMQSLLSLQEAQNNFFSKPEPAHAPELPPQQPEEFKTSLAEVAVEPLAVQPNPQVLVSLEKYRERQLQKAAQDIQAQNPTSPPPIKKTPSPMFSYSMWGTIPAIEPVAKSAPAINTSA